MACIIYSAITVLRYQDWGVESLTILAISQNSRYDRDDKWWFVKKNDEPKYTEQENKALALFSIIIVLSVIEIILAAALAKVSDSSHKGAQQPTIPMYVMYYQVRYKWHCDMYSYYETHRFFLRLTITLTP